MPKIIYVDSSGAERAIELGAEQVLIGRNPECQIQTQDGLVSRRHARIIVHDGLYWIEDLQSANGVYVNSQRVPQAQLRPGDEVVCGSLTLRFVADVAAAIRRTQGMQAYVEPAAPSAQSTGSGQLAALQAELDSERRRRMDLEFERDEARKQLAAMAAQPPAGANDEELQRLRRRNDQLESELRRSRGAPAGGGDGASRALEAERDQLKARVQALEAQAASKPPVDEMEFIRLQRRVDQLQSELRRVRGGEAPAAPAADAGRVAELEDRVRRLTEERDEALRRSASPAAPSPGQSSPDTTLAEELMRARRQIDQMQSELRRLRAGGAQPEAPPGADLEAALRQLRDVERERDSLRALVAGGQGGKGKAPPRAGELIGAVSDGLADIRGALRAAGDEVALEQLEQIRNQLRELSDVLA